MSLVMIAKTQTFSSTYHGICTSKNHESFTAPPVWCLGFLGKHQPRLQRRISQRNRPKCPNRLREWSPRVGKGQQQTPWNMIPSQKERVVFQLSFFRVELLNFGGVSFWLALMIASSICELVKKSKWPLALFWCLQSNYLLCKTHNFGDAFCNSIVILKRKENINISYQYTYHIISYQYIISYHKYNYIYILHHLCDPERVMFRLQNQAFQASPKGHSDHAKVTRKDAAATAMETFRWTFSWRSLSITWGTKGLIHESCVGWWLKLTFNFFGTVWVEIFLVTLTNLPKIY